MTMSVCCLAAGRLEDGISVPPGLQVLRNDASSLSSECYNAVVEAMPSELATVTEWYPLMKAKALLASACLQNEQVKRAVFHAGDYNSLAMSRGFHDEASWPDDLNEREKQERRRLVSTCQSPISQRRKQIRFLLTVLIKFWGSYQADQYMANSFGFVSRHREAKTAVRYPAEVDDDADITLHGIRPSSDNTTSFLRGWNFCTDLYRILEHISGFIRRGRQFSSEEPGGQVTSFLVNRHSPKALVADSLRLVSQLYEDLPDELKQIKAITGDPQRDRNGFIGNYLLISSLQMSSSSIADEFLILRAQLRTS